MYALFSKSRKIMIVVTLSLMLTGMSALLIASDARRLDSPVVSAAGKVLPELGVEQALVPQQGYSSLANAMQTSRYGAQPQAPGRAYQVVSRPRVFTGALSAIKPSIVPAPHNIGYDSITNGITAGNSGGNIQTIFISEGETVNFKGQYTRATDTWGDLSRTDSYVQIEDPSLHPGADVCGLADSLLTHRYDANHKNDFTGPMRKGVSGIFALGPEDTGEGYYEPAAGQGCETLTVPAGAPAGHIFVEVASAVDPALVTHKLCQLKDTTVFPYVNSPYARNLVLDSTWDNEDITGAVIRINWKDLQKYDPDTTSVVFDWAQLDTEFNQAAKRGKVIFLELLAGDGIPDWVFNDFPNKDDITDGPADAALAVPITLRDTGSDGTGPGWVRKNGSPADPHYIALVENLVRKVVNHLRNDSRFFQALGSLKVTGTNFMTGEMRLQNSCKDDGSCPNCWCNTEIWQTALGTALPAFSGSINNSQATNGGGYTETGMYAFAQTIENAIFDETQGQKSQIFMLIQAGLPAVRVAGDYWRESTQMGGPVNASGDFSAIIQTVNLLKFGRQGLFQAASGAVQDAAVGRLFIPQHAGLQLLRQDQPDDATPDPSDTKSACGQQTTPALSATYGKFEAPMPTSGSDGAGGCPNPYAVGESYKGQLIGFQTNNLTAVNTPDHLDSTLWNGTANSKMMFWEGYEPVLWKAAIEKGKGGSALPLSTSNYFSSMSSDYQKNLNYWGNELHRRRTALAAAAPTEPNLADPFPTVHSVTFDRDLKQGEIKRYYFINPARCATATGPKYGTVVVMGVGK